MIYSAPGIITANKRSTDNSCAFLGDEINVPAPCGRFVWKGGSVKGHNIDMNPY